TQPVRLAEAHPAILAVLGTPGIRAWQQFDCRLAGAREVVAGDLAAVVGPGIHIDLTPGELELADARLLAYFTTRRLQMLLAGLHQALGEVPVPENAQHQHAQSVRGLAQHDGTAGHRCDP